MAWVLRPSRFISISCCTSRPLSNGGPPPPRIGRLYTLVRGWGIFNRLYGDFHTGADSMNVMTVRLAEATEYESIFDRFRKRHYGIRFIKGGRSKRTPSRSVLYPKRTRRACREMAAWPPHRHLEQPARCETGSKVHET